MSFRELGTSKESRDRLKATGDYDRFFNQYRADLACQDEHLDKIVELVNSGESVALLCFEEDAYKCHRAVVAHEIERKDRNGITIKHIRNAC